MSNGLAEAPGSPAREVGRPEAVFETKRSTLKHVRYTKLHTFALRVASRGRRFAGQTICEIAVLSI